MPELFIVPSSSKQESFTYHILRCRICLKNHLQDQILVLHCHFSSHFISIEAWSLDAERNYGQNVLVLWHRNFCSQGICNQQSWSCKHWHMCITSVHNWGLKATGKQPLGPDKYSNTILHLVDLQSSRRFVLHDLCHLSWSFFVLNPCLCISNYTCS